MAQAHWPIKVRRELERQSALGLFSSTRLCQAIHDCNLEIRCVYIIKGALIDAVVEDFPDDALDHAAHCGTLVLPDVGTSDAIGQARTRRGMAAVRRATLQNYRNCCALCDITDAQLLVASPITRWADRPDARGRLVNLICLCRVHDPLFELGYFALTDELAVMWRPKMTSAALRTLANSCTGPFSPPLQQTPSSAYLNEHRTRVGS